MKKLYFSIKRQCCHSFLFTSLLCVLFLLFSQFNKAYANSDYAFDSMALKRCLGDFPTNSFTDAEKVSRFFKKLYPETRYRTHHVGEETGQPEIQADTTNTQTLPSGQHDFKNSPLPLRDVLADPNLFGQYLNHLNSLEGRDSPSLNMFSSRNAFLPATLDVAYKIDKGGPVQGGSYYETYIEVIREVTSDDKTVKLNLFVIISEEDMTLARHSETMNALNLHITNTDHPALDVSLNSENLTQSGCFVHTIDLGPVNPDSPLSTAKGTLELRIEDFLISKLLFKAWIP